MAIQFRHLEHQDGVTRIAGHRMRAFDIFDIQRHGAAPDQIAEEYALPLGAVYEALAYAFDHPVEMASLEQRDRDAYAAGRGASGRPVS
jgi:uncharacterized protein (DUF433 family)